MLTIAKIIHRAGEEMNNIKWILLFLTLLIISSCMHMKDTVPPLQVVQYVDISRYTGTWYEIAMASETCTYFVSNSGNDNLDGLTEATAWKTIAHVNGMTLRVGETVCFKRGDTWRLPTDQYLSLRSGDSTGYITYTAYGTGRKPLFLGSVEKNSTSDWTEISPNIWATADNLFYYQGWYYEVGNIIFNNEESVGKNEVNGITDLDNQGEFYYDPARRRVLIYSTSNPASFYSDIECALDRGEDIGGMFFIGRQGAYININNLDLRYSGSHGINVQNCHHIIISDNDISYIGGAVQFASVEQGIVRYGNAIQAYDAASDIDIERNRIWEIFDGAISLEGQAGSKNNINVRYNFVSKAGNCLYYYSTGGTASNLYYENNTCVYSGYGWGSVLNQRLSMGNHFLTYGNRANTSNFYVRNNIFYEAMNYGLKLNGWTESTLNNLTMDNNLWYDSSDMKTIPYSPPWAWIIWYCRNTCKGYSMANFSQNQLHVTGSYQADTGKDLHSIATNPYFTDEANNDYSPIIGSPACTMSTTGTYAGALPCVPAPNSPGR
jgi:hypothetical protein